MTERVRRLDERSRQAVLTHLLALDADDRYARFGSAIRDASISAYVEGLDFERDLLLGMESADGLIGLAHVGYGVGELAELALSVTPRWRYRGVARTLFDGAAERTAGCGIVGLACMHGHPATLRIAVRLGLFFSVQNADPRVIIHMKPACP